MRNPECLPNYEKNRTIFNYITGQINSNFLILSSFFLIVVLCNPLVTNELHYPKRYKRLLKELKQQQKEKSLMMMFFLRLLNI